MFAIFLLVTGFMLLSLFYFLGGHRSHLLGARKKIKLPSDIVSEPRKESLDRGFIENQNSRPFNPSGRS
jgi:hypothetical protein